MKEEHAKKHWNSAVVAAVHCGINSADALTVKYLGIRNRGRHEGFIRLLNELKLEDIQKKGRQLHNLLNLKSKAEYDSKLITASEADEAFRDADRFYKWMKGVLEK